MRVVELILTLMEIHKQVYVTISCESNAIIYVRLRNEGLRKKNQQNKKERKFCVLLLFQFHKLDRFILNHISCDFSRMLY